MWPEPSSPLLQASPSRVPSQRNRALPYSPDEGLNSFPPRRLTAEGRSLRKRIALSAVLTVSNVVGPIHANVKCNITNSTENLSKIQSRRQQRNWQKKRSRNQRQKQNYLLKNPLRKKQNQPPRVKKKSKERNRIPK